VEVTSVYYRLFGNIKDDNCIGLRTGNRFYELNRTAHHKESMTKKKVLLTGIDPKLIDSSLANTTGWDASRVQATA
jgi:hypothetical protein